MQEMSGYELFMPDVLDFYAFIKIDELFENSEQVNSQFKLDQLFVNSKRADPQFKTGGKSPVSSKVEFSNENY